MVPANELAVLRAVAESALDTPATVNRITVTRTASGGQAPASTVLATCNVMVATPTAPILAQFADKIGAQQAWMVRLPSSVSPRPGDQIVIDANQIDVSQGDLAGTYTVQVPLPQSYSLLTDVLATRVV